MFRIGLWIPIVVVFGVMVTAESTVVAQFRLPDEPPPYNPEDPNQQVIAERAAELVEHGASERDAMRMYYAALWMLEYGVPLHIIEIEFDLAKNVLRSGGSLDELLRLMAHYTSQRMLHGTSSSDESQSDEAHAPVTPSTGASEAFQNLIIALVEAEGNWPPNWRELFNQFAEQARAERWTALQWTLALMALAIYSPATPHPDQTFVWVPRLEAFVPVPFGLPQLPGSPPGENTNNSDVENRRSGTQQKDPAEKEDKSQGGKRAAPMSLEKSEKNQPANAVGEESENIYTINLPSDPPHSFNTVELTVQPPGTTPQINSPISPLHGIHPFNLLSDPPNDFDTVELTVLRANEIKDRENTSTEPNWESWYLRDPRDDWNHTRIGHGSWQYPEASNEEGGTVPLWPAGQRNSRDEWKYARIGHGWFPDNQPSAPDKGLPGTFGNPSPFFSEITDDAPLAAANLENLIPNPSIYKFELREISHYAVALKSSRTSRGVPLLEDIPVEVLFDPPPAQDSAAELNSLSTTNTEFPEWERSPIWKKLHNAALRQLPLPGLRGRSPLDPSPGNATTYRDEVSQRIGQGVQFDQQAQSRLFPDGVPSFGDSYFPDLKSVAPVDLRWLNDTFPQRAGGSVGSAVFGRTVDGGSRTGITPPSGVRLPR